MNMTHYERKVMVVYYLHFRKGDLLDTSQKPPNTFVLFACTGGFDAITRI